MIIKDCIYRYITVPELCQAFIDTPEFQRLRRIKQLGSVHNVYPSAVHTRFEHSLGVMHLAGQAVDSLFPSFEPRKKDLIMLAGLLHDVGHMAYSHLFDSISNDDHEHRSVDLLISMNQRVQCLSDKEIDCVKGMILGIIREGSPWMYQIVNNKLCGVDVDKMDYLQRDAYHTGIPGFQPDYIIRQMTIDEQGNLAFKHKAYTDVESIFITRKRMFANVYYHKTTIKIDAVYRGMIADAIHRLDPRQIKYHFGDDCRAETYLRKEYPQIFELLDRRDTTGALHRGAYSITEQPHASYTAECSDLETVMSKVIFI